MLAISPNILPRPWGSLPIWGLLLALPLSLGCGQKSYEERLQQSRVFYDYLLTVDEGLASPPWIRNDLGMSLRLPKPFQAPMPGPEIFKDKEGEVSYGPDPRQKNALGTALPGLVEAWETTLDDPSGQPDAWIFLLTNQDRFANADQGGPAPDAFFTDLENELMRVFQVTIPEGETSRVGDNLRFRQWSPAQKSERSLYTTPKDYTVIRFVPDAEFNAADLQATLYERKAGKLQVALVVVTRKSTSAAFRQRVELALETFEIEEIVPRRKGNEAAGGAAPATSPSTRPGGGTSGF